MAKTKTKAPAPRAKLADPRNEALERMTKAELVRTVKTLDKRVTKLLNENAKLQGEIQMYTAKPCTIAERALRGCPLEATRTPEPVPPIGHQRANDNAAYTHAPVPPIGHTRFPWET